MKRAEDKLKEFRRFGSVLGLSRMQGLLEKLGNPERDRKFIHVAGTNGKGSICRYMYEVLEEAGYKVGLYTSPYVEVFNERIEYDRKYISEEDLNRLTDLAVEKAHEMVKEGKESPTEFEVITAVAFLYFREKNCDYVILEVGLGGRGDSTNVIENPLASVIGTISLDHTAVLGDTIPGIAMEKAGIIKAGCPVISGTKNPEAKEVIRRRAAEMESEFIDASVFPREIRHETIAGQTFDCRIGGVYYQAVELSIMGAYQVDNAVTAMTCLLALRGKGELAFSEEALRTGLRRAHQVGRMEVLCQDPAVIVDGAHNPEGAEGLRKTISDEFSGKKILMVTGILADKDVETMLRKFTGITKSFLATRPDNPRAMGAEELAEKIRCFGARCEAVRDPGEAVRKAWAFRSDFDLLLFAGSLYLIGSVKETLQELF